MSSSETHLIHPTAIVYPGAVIGEGTTVGPYSVIGPNVSLGARNAVGPHVVIEGYTEIGDENQIFQFASVGSRPQDLKYRGEKSRLIIGDRNLIREYVTLQPGTEGGGMKTEMGSGNLFMANSHLGHDSIIGDNNVIANSVAIAGHVTIGNRVVIGGLAAVHQFVHVGDFALIAAGCMTTQDVPPGFAVHGDRVRLIGINTIGLKRAGISPEEISEIRKVYRQLFLSSGILKTKLDQLEASGVKGSLTQSIIAFIRASTRGIPKTRGADDDASSSE